MGQLEQMRVFVRIVEAGSVSAAAEQLNMAKSMVSRRLTELEKRLGNVLLQRTTRRITLTDIGQQYYQSSLGILDEVARLDQHTIDVSAQVAGPLHVAAPLSFGTLHLTPAIDAFLKRYPNIQLKLSLSDHQHHLVAQGIDLALRIADLQDSSLKARHLTKIHFMLVASPQYLRQSLAIQRPEQLSQHKILHYSYQSQQTWTFVKGEQRVAMPYKAYLSADNGEMLRDLAIAGQGITLLPTFICWQAVLTGQLQPLLTDYQMSHLNAWLVYPNTRYQSRRLRVFMDFLSERFEKNPYWDQSLSRYTLAAKD
ncbi:LysR family transcriptional regulator [Celerinatantimonas yamalensis]|uniref:LysR family transcriptional regulator n=1 Tax=Celerinatantimonas yamalensis TaxID=559956 RepID=A0ABW9G2I8_9GAMM